MNNDNVGEGGGGPITLMGVRQLQARTAAEKGVPDMMIFSIGQDRYRAVVGIVLFFLQQQ